MISGDVAEQYKRVWDYAATVRKCNEGSNAVVKCERIERPPPLFQRMYICLQPCKEGFMAGCRPILGVDGCHLRGPYPEILLTAVGKDDNNNIFPVAWCIVEVENSQTWTWFLELLVKDLGSVAEAVTFMHEREEAVTYMSDMQKGLLDAFKVVFPNVETRYCCRHIWANVKRQFPGERKFNEAMRSIKLINDDAFKYMNDIPASSWSIHAFSTKSKSVVKMVEKQKDYIRNCDVNQADVWEFEVDHTGDTFVVDLEKKKCGCFRWELMGIPCCPALAYIEKKRLNYEDYVHGAYHVNAYRAYAPPFHPMPGHDQWEKTEQPEPAPPKIRVMPGRPSQKTRRKEAGEVNEKKRNKCSNCGHVGHNKKKCKNPPKPEAPKSKGGRPKTTDPIV
ncbi:uncharacterized protein LOC104898713 [Beta vulgaris subsp. vulgaris]|uniref:uncharacterized protein LOC104898713 n=1 Tax=Beta vulgaris subsp. vulgaris TaxID=3555 RepID=UPI00053F94F4|nr:uncharacterized protein LOC104898713 [Beta vulgaris subsp. vulgaris]